MADVNLNINLQSIAGLSGRGVASSQKATEVYKVSAGEHLNKINIAANDDVIVQTSALYVITPDGVIHSREINKNGEVNYSPNITMQSYSKTIEG